MNHQKFENAVWDFQKSWFSITFLNWEKQKHLKIHILNLWMKWEKLCCNLGFNVKYKSGNSHKKGWRVRDWPSGLRCCNQNWKIPSSNPTICSDRLSDPPRFKVPGDYQVEIIITQSLTSGWWGYLLGNGLNLDVGQPSSS